MSERTPTPPPAGTRPPPSDQSTPRGVLIKGIAGTPGVAVGAGARGRRHEGCVRAAARRIGALPARSSA